MSPQRYRFSAGGVPGRIRSRLPGYTQQTRHAIISKCSLNIHRPEIVFLDKKREVSAGSARATSAPGTPLLRALRCAGDYSVL